MKPVRTFRALGALATAAALGVGLLLPSVAHAEEADPSASVVTEAESMAATVKFTSLRASDGNTTIQTGRSIRIRGTASSSLVGKTVKLQRFTGTSWIAMPGLGGKVASDGTFNFTSTTTNVGKHEYRVAVSGLSTVSNKLTMVTFRWRTLDGIGSKESSSQYDIRMNGKLYLDAFRVRWEGDTVAFDLRRSCTQLQVFMGPSDDSAFGNSVLANYILDGTSRWANSISVGSPVLINSNVTGAIEARFEKRSSTSYGDPLWLGGGRALCAF